MSTEDAWPRFKSEDSQARYLAAYDAALADWPVPRQDLDIATRLGPTRVIASGSPDAPPLVLLPSLAATAAVWRPNVAALSQRFRVYAVDVIGQPGRSLATRRLLNRRQYADWLSDLFNALGVARAAIVGCSFGGFLALNQAALTPERVGRVVLISPAGTFVGLSWRFRYVMQVKGPMLRLIRRVTGSRRAPDIADLSGRRVPPDPANAKWRALMSATMAEGAEVGIINATVFSRTELRKIRTPVLLLIGEYERLYDPQTTLDLAKARVPGLTGAVVPGADHIAAMAQPDDVNLRILQFLDAAPTA